MEGYVHIAKHKDAVETVASIVSMAAVVVGGLWALREFVWKREVYPKLDVTQSAYSRVLSTDVRLLHITLTLENKGTGVIRPKHVSLEIKQVDPWPEARYGPRRYAEIESGTSDWPYITGRDDDVSGMQIEPNEKQDITYDFFIAPGAKVVLIKSRIENPVNELLGWDNSSVYEIPLLTSAAPEPIRQ